MPTPAGDAMSTGHLVFRVCNKGCPMIAEVRNGRLFVGCCFARTRARTPDSLNRDRARRCRVEVHLAERVAMCRSTVADGRRVVRASHAMRPRSFIAWASVDMPSAAHRAVRDVLITWRRPQ
jgi:hypothetical protein